MNKFFNHINVETIKSVKLFLNRVSNNTLKFVFTLVEAYHYVTDLLTQNTDYFLNIINSYVTPSYINGLVEKYIYKINLQFKLLLDTEFRIQYLNRKQYMLDQINTEKHIKWYLQEDEKCRRHLDDIFKHLHPCKYFFNKLYYYKIPKFYQKFVNYLAVDTELKTIFFAVICSWLHLICLNRLTSKYEIKIASLKNKLPKLEYLGDVGKKLNNYLYNKYGEIDINEIQIGLSSQNLNDLYNYPIYKRIYMEDTDDLLETPYTKKNLLKYKPILKALLPLNKRLLK